MRESLYVDTVEVLEAAHKLYAAAGKLKHTDLEKAKEIARVADSGASAVIPYIKNRTAPVQKRHYEAMQRMVQYAKGIQAEGVAHDGTTPNIKKMSE